MSHTGSRSAAKLRAMIRARDGDDCCICGKPIDFTRAPGTFMGPSLEHVIPVCAGGSRSDPANLRLAHARPCNQAKGGVLIHDGISGELRERYARKIAAAVGQVNALTRPPRYHDRGGERARQVRRAKTGARERRGPWGGLIVVEERGPWGGIIVTNNYSPAYPPPVIERVAR